MGAMLASLIINAWPLIVFVDNKIDANRMFMAAVSIWYSCNRLLYGMCEIDN